MVTPTSLLPVLPPRPMEEEAAHRVSRMLGRLLGIGHRRALRLHQARQHGTAGLLAWAGEYLPQHFTQPPSAMHLWLAERLDELHHARPAKLNVIGPRGSAKSTVATLAYVLRMAVEGLEPYIWIVSDTESQTQLHLENIAQELLDNARLAADYAAAGRSRSWRQDRLVLRNGVTIEALSTGQHVRGRRRRANRPTLIVCDDIQNDRHAASPLRRQKSREWFHGALLPAGSQRTNVIHLATALHRDALALELARTPGWTSQTFQAVVRWPENMAAWREWESLVCDLANPERTRAGRSFYEANREMLEAGSEVLWPEMEDLYSLMCLRVESGRSAFEREKQSSPINPEFCEWPEECFDEHIWFEEWPSRLTVRTMAVDPSKGGDDRLGDYSAIVLLGVDPQGVLFVQADLARRNTAQIVADGVALYRRFRPDAFGVEANQFQELLAGEFMAEFARQQVFGVRPYLLDNHINKLVRIRRLGPHLAGRRIRFQANCASTRLLVDQLRDFPIGDHDDGPDALEMALRLAQMHLQGRQAVDSLGDCLPIRVW